MSFGRWYLLFFNLFPHLLSRPRCWFFVEVSALLAPEITPCPAFDLAWVISAICTSHLWYERDVHTHGAGTGLLCFSGYRYVLQNSLWNSFWLGNAASSAAAVVSRAKRHAVDKLCLSASTFKAFESEVYSLHLQRKSIANKLRNTVYSVLDNAE